MADDDLIEKVQDLSDLELAVLLSLVNREHCLISTPRDAVSDLVAELQLIASQTFGLSCAVIECTPSTTLDDFAAGLCPKQSPQSATTGRTDSYFVAHSAFKDRATAPSVAEYTGVSAIANCVLARNLDQAPHAVQIQALELLRTRRIFTRTSVQTAPKQFLFIPVLSAAQGGSARVTRHLNDFFFVAHWHHPDDGYVNLEELDGGSEGDTASLDSVIKKPPNLGNATKETLISEHDISLLARLSKGVSIDVDITRYQMNIISFLRMHRAVADGITPTATKHLESLMRSLAPMHGLDYVTPAMVGLAVRKTYLHRISIAPPQDERSMQWGSRLEGIKELLHGIGPEEVIEEVLEMVTAPV